MMTLEDPPSAEQVRAARSLLGWSQQDLAAKAGVAVSTIADFERGQRNPMPNNALAIRQALERAGIVFTEGGVSRGFTWTFMSEASTGSLHINFDNDSATAVADFVSIFGVIEQGKASISNVQCASPKLKAQLSGFVDTHGTSNPQLKRLRKRITDLRDGEFFLISPTAVTSSKDQLDQEQLLFQLNHPEERSLNAEYQQLFGSLLDAYNLCLPRTDQRNDIGAARKSDRRCRFCAGTTASGATFEKKAHAFSAATGNQNLKLKDECDECNQYFGDKIEPALIELLNIQRVFLGIKSSGSLPTIQFSDGKIFHDGKRMIIKATNMSEDASGALNVHLGSGRPIVPQHVYRTLCKYALSVIPEDQLPALEKTIRWVRYGDFSSFALPKIATAIVLLPPDPSAQVTLYVRKNDALRTPHVVCEYRLGCYMYVYALPFSTRDDWNLIEFFEEDTFKDTFHHYSYVPTWNLQDFSDIHPITASQSIRLKPRDK